MTVPHVVAGPIAEGALFQGRYEVKRCIKAGGMGAIYECVHVATKRRVALKVMLPQMFADAGMRARFQLEAQATSNVESEHLVQTFDAGIDDVTGSPFLVMELLRGEDLAEVLHRRGRLPPGETVEILRQVATALDKTHAAAVDPVGRVVLGRAPARACTR